MHRIGFYAEHAVGGGTYRPLYSKFLNLSSTTRFVAFSARFFLIGIFPQNITARIIGFVSLRYVTGFLIASTEKIADVGRSAANFRHLLTVSLSSLSRTMGNAERRNDLTGKELVKQWRGC